MQNIQPFYNWRDYYIAAEDEKSPFYGRSYNEFQYSQKVYNYFIHPQWDSIESPTLYAKILFTDYNEGYSIIELLGEWNDTIENDVMLLKRNLVDFQIRKGISKFIIIGENVLNFHSSDDAYYEEWHEDLEDSGGWVIGLNFSQQVLQEMSQVNIEHYILFDELDNWRSMTPALLMKSLLAKMPKRIND